MRDMYDAIAANVGYIPHNAEMVAGYDTGTLDVGWTSAMWGMFPNAVKVHINQGYASPPKITSNVIDVESGSWSPDQVPGLLANMEDAGVERPTVYCARNTIGFIPKLPKVYDMWVAWPGYAASVAPMQPGWNVVAVQYSYVGTFDISKVFDATWPLKPVTPVTEEDMINVQVTAESFVPFPAGTFKAVHVYRDFLSPEETSVVRLAFHVSGSEFSVEEKTLNSPQPEVVNIPAAECDAVTLSIVSGKTPVGFTLA